MWVEDILSTHYIHGQRCFNTLLLWSNWRGAFISPPWTVAGKELDTSTSCQSLPAQEGGTADGRFFMSWREFKQSSERQKILARRCLNISGRFQSWMLTQSNPSHYTPGCSDTAVHTCLCTLGPGAIISRKFTCSDVLPLVPSTRGSLWSDFLLKPSLWTAKLCQTLNLGQYLNTNYHAYTGPSALKGQVKALYEKEIRKFEWFPQCWTPCHQKLSN